MNKRFKEAEIELEVEKKDDESKAKEEVPGLKNLNNLGKMYNPNYTFKGYKRKVPGAMA